MRERWPGSTICCASFAHPKSNDYLPEWLTEFSITFFKVTSAIHKNLGLQFVHKDSRIVDYWKLNQSYNIWEPRKKEARAFLALPRLLSPLIILSG